MRGVNRDHLTADSLRSIGISQDDLASDAELVEVVQLLLDLGADLDDLVDRNLRFMAGPLVIRPDATVDVSASGYDGDREFVQLCGLALGFNGDAGPSKLTPGEIDTLQFFQQLRPMLGDDELLALMRVIGTAAARIARSVISTLRLNYETPIAEETDHLSDVATAYGRLSADLLPQFLDSVGTVLRRHMAIIAGRDQTWELDRHRAATIEQQSVGFVDLVGFTRFTERANAREFVEALTQFERQVHEVVVQNGGTLVKLIGDEAMFVAPTPTSALAIARRLAKLEIDGSELSTVRIGIATGDVIAVGGDFYGTVVNSASRIVDLAEPHTIVVTEAVRDQAHGTLVFEPLGRTAIRGLSEQIELFRLAI